MVFSLAIGASAAVSGWRADPDFIRVARLVQEHCDPFIVWNPVAYPKISKFGYQRFLDVPDEVDAAVRQALEQGGKEHMVLFPSATPHQRHTSRFTANAIRYIEAGLRYGYKED